MSDNPIVEVRAYRLVWKNNEGHGQVYLFINSDDQPDITITVQSAADLVAWDILLSQKAMKKVNWQQKVIFTDKKNIE